MDEDIYYCILLKMSQPQLCKMAAINSMFYSLVKEIVFTKKIYSFPNIFDRSSMLLFNITTAINHGTNDEARKILISHPSQIKYCFLWSVTSKNYIINYSFCHNLLWRLAVDTEIRSEFYNEIVFSTQSLDHCCRFRAKNLLKNWEFENMYEK